MGHVKGGRWCGMPGALVVIPEYMKFTELQHREPHIEGLVNCYIHLLEIESNQQVNEDADVFALRFVREILTLFWVGHQSNVRVICLVLARLLGDRVIHQLEKQLLHLKLGAGTQIGILGDVALEPARWLELDDAVVLSQLQPMLDIEFEVDVVEDVHGRVEEAG